MKVCRNCHESKPDREFPYAKDEHNLCRECKKERNREYKHSVRGIQTSLANSARRRAAKNGTQFALSPDDIHVPERCPVFGFPLSVGGENGGASYNSPALDRIYPHIGYVPGNVLVVSSLANNIKSSASPDEIRKVADFYANLYDQPEGLPDGGTRT